MHPGVGPYSRLLTTGESRRGIARSRLLRISVGLALLEAMLPAVASSAAMFMGLGDLPGGEFYSRATAVSADGSVVVGESSTTNPNRSTLGSSHGAFRWAQSTGMVGLGFLSEDSSNTAVGVSGDGSVVVGSSVFGRDPTPFRWTQSEGMRAINPGGSSISPTQVSGISADGSLVVGLRLYEDHGAGALFNDGGVDFVPGLAPLAISGDGSTVVGQSSQAARLTSADGLVGLGNFADNPSGASQANAVSFDGSVVVGYGISGREKAFRWTHAGGLVALDSSPPPTGYSIASGISGDGSVVVGQRDYGVEQPNTSSREAFVWTASGGMRGVREMLVNDYGLDLNGWTLENALAVSADGRAIVGHGFNPSGDIEAWIAVIPEPSTALLLTSGLVGLAVARRWQA